MLCGVIVRVGDLESHFSQDTFELHEIIGLLVIVGRLGEMLEGLWC